MELIDWGSLSTAIGIGVAVVVGTWFLLMVLRAAWPRRHVLRRRKQRLAEEERLRQERRARHPVAEEPVSEDEPEDTH
jgi:heme exporter protein D